MWYKAIVKFRVGEIPHSFECVHNLPNTFGLSLKDAVDNWVLRTEDFSFKSFREYIFGKIGADYLIFSPEEWQDKELIKSILNPE